MAATLTSNIKKSVIYCTNLPDFFVETGETCSVFDRETNIKTIN